MLTAREASIATSIWPITQRQDRSGRKKLNWWQKKAITLACNNDFTLIQGPPGIQLICSYVKFICQYVFQGLERV